MEEQFEQLLRDVVDLYQKGQYLKAIPTAEAVYKTALKESHPLLASWRFILSLLYCGQGRYEEAEPLLQESLVFTQQLLGNDHPDVVPMLNNLASLYRDQGRYWEAEPLFQESLALARRVLGNDHPDVANSLYSLASLYLVEMRYWEAEPLFQESLALARRVLGNDHPDVANSLIGLAGVYRSQGRYGEAEPLYREALVLRRQLLGNDHPDVATSLNSLALLYESQRHYSKAEPLYREALVLRRQLLGNEHPHVASSLSQLGGLYRNQGRYSEAELLLQEALALSRRMFSNGHLDVVRNLNDLALLYRDQGRYSEAEPLYQEALALTKRLLGKGHSIDASRLNNLASLYESQGRYGEAEPLYQEALALSRQRDNDHPQVATILCNLAGLYCVQGRYSEAEPLHRDALVLRKRLLGNDHPDVAISLNHLAGLYRDQGRYGEAEPLYQEALALSRQRLGNNHSQVAVILNDLALLYCDQRRYSEAESYFQDALALDRQQLGNDHPKVATVLNNLAGLYRDQRRYSETELYLQDALAIRKRCLGIDHPDVANSLHNLAVFYVDQRRYSEAFKHLVQAGEVETKVLGQIFRSSIDQQRLAYLKNIQVNLELLLFLVTNQGAHLVREGQTDVTQAALQQVLHRKALGAEAGAAFQLAVLSEQYEGLAPLLERFQTLNEQISALTFKPLPTDQKGLADHRDHLQELRGQKDDLERQLCREVPEMSLQQLLKEVTVKKVAEALPSGSMLVEYVRFDAWSAEAIREGIREGNIQRQIPRYAAFVLAARQPDSVALIDLGKAEPIDEAIKALVQTSAVVGTRAPNPSGQAARNKAELERLGQSLYNKLIAPLTDYLPPNQQIFIAPDGELACLPFHILPGKTQPYLMQDYILRYITVGRDLLRFQATYTSFQPTPALVLADPNYNLAHNGASADSSPQPAEANQPFSSLPGTRFEGEAIAAKLRVRPYLKDNALKSSVRQCKSPYILHMATHGYFWNDLPAQLPTPTSNFIGFSHLDRLTAAAIQNPSARSGLAFAGANTTLQSETLPADADDGLLTTQDAARLNLLATQLVVASACETGLGDVLTGEGVLGLRRAFVLAGAQTLVMSLWKVSDIATALLMDRFYDNLLVHHMGRADGLKEAQYYIRDLTISQIREQWLSPAARAIANTNNLDLTTLENLCEEYPNDAFKPFEAPQYWAAFICQGNPSPLPSMTAFG